MVRQTGNLRNLIIRTAQSTGEIMVILQCYRPHDSIEPLLDALYAKFPGITSLNYVLNSKGNETFHDLDVITYRGKPYIEEEMEGLRFRIGPKSFYQTNSEGAHQLYKVARDFADLKGDELVYDLYTGAGTIASFVAHQARKVIGVEYVEQAVADAHVNAEINNITNTEFYAGDMKDILTADFTARTTAAPTSSSPTRPAPACTPTWWPASWSCAPPASSTSAATPPPRPATWNY